MELIQLKPRDANGEVAFNEDALIERVRKALSTSSGETDGPIGKFALSWKVSVDLSAL